MASTADFKNGMCIHFKNDLYTIIQFQHVKPGKGPAFVRTKLKNVKTGKVIDNTFTAGLKVDVARIERRPYQFLYKDDLGYNLMHVETYEQISLEESLFNAADLLKDGDTVEAVFHADTETPLYVELKPHVSMEVTYTEPGLRGDTSSTSSLKPATVETGATIMVPLFINTGDKIKIDTRDHSYVERVKE
ncbi:MAG: elongation factor P [Marinifilaceae bacterium]|jgi:elongation factor P|nr:elongation factor P [Marinifilaceae bacterium]